MSGAGNDLTQPADNKQRAFRSGTNPTANAFNNLADQIQPFNQENPIINQYQNVFTTPAPYWPTEHITMHTSGLTPFFSGLHRSMHSAMYLGYNNLPHELTTDEFQLVSRWALAQATNDKAAEQLNLQHSLEINHLDELTMPASVTNVINATGTVNVCQNAFRLIPRYAIEPAACPLLFWIPLQPVTFVADTNDARYYNLSVAQIAAAREANPENDALQLALNIFEPKVIEWNRLNAAALLPTTANAAPLLEKYSLFVNSMAENGYIEIGDIDLNTEGNASWLLNTYDAATNFRDGDAHAVIVSHISGEATPAEIALAAIIQDRNHKMVSARTGFRFNTPPIIGTTATRTTYATACPIDFFE